MWAQGSPALGSTAALMRTRAHSCAPSKQQLLRALQVVAPAENRAPGRNTDTGWGPKAAEAECGYAAHSAIFKLVGDRVRHSNSTQLQDTLLFTEHWNERAMWHHLNNARKQDHTLANFLCTSADDDETPKGLLCTTCARIVVMALPEAAMLFLASGGRWQVTNQRQSHFLDVFLRELEGILGSASPTFPACFRGFPAREQ